MGGKILYIGDDSLQGAAGYVGGVMNAGGLPFDHLNSADTVDTARLGLPRAAIIISDYPAAGFAPGAMEAVAEAVRAGCGLLMIGGWASFHGLSGRYDATPLAELLPVQIESQDDRINWPHVCLVSKERDYEILDGLPFGAPPSIGGLNRVKVKPDAMALLSARFFRPRAAGGTWTLDPVEEHPLLAVGSHQAGRTACYMSDFAPHWCGGLVDWGMPRVTCHAGAGTVEVGSLYARLVTQLVRWVARA